MSEILKERYLTKKYEEMSWSEIADAPVSAISGVSESDAADLKEAFGIDTVMKLAGNQYLCIAQGINSFSKATGEILDKSFKSEEYEELRKLPVHAISGVSEGDGALLKRAFGIDTIQEFAENKYVCVAQTIVTLAFLESLITE